METFEGAVSQVDFSAAGIVPVPEEEESGLRSARPFLAGNGGGLVYSARQGGGEEVILPAPWLSPSFSVLLGFQQSFSPQEFGCWPYRLEQIMAALGQPTS